MYVHVERNIIFHFHKSTNGMVNSAVKKEMDIIGASLTLTYSRSLSLKFLLPLGFETHALYVKSPDGEELV